MWIPFVFEVVLIMIVGSFGLLGNCLLLGIFAKLEQKTNFHRLMITMEIYDIIYIILCILIFVVPEICEDYKKEGHYFHIVPTALPMIQLALTGSIYCSVGISVERYLTVCHPFYMLERNWSAKRYIIPIVLFSMIFNGPRFF